MRTSASQVPTAGEPEQVVAKAKSPPPAALIPKRTRARREGSVDPRSVEAQSWWPDFLASKDDFSLQQLAHRFGVAPISLQRAMKRTGVERKSQRARFKLS